MHKGLIIALLVSGAVAALWFSGLIPHGPSQPVVAEIDGDPIGIDRYRREYTDYLLETGLPDNPKRRHDFLQRLISVDLLVREQKDAGVAETDPYRFSRNRITRKLLIEGYLAKHVYDSVEVTDEDLRDMFARVNTTLKASHLYSRNLQEAEVLYERLRQGERFEDLAREVFSSTELQDSGGSLGYFGFDEMDPRFEDAAYSMEIGEISTPVRTAQGYSIIRLDDRFIKPILTESEFATRKKNLYRYFAVRKRQQAKKDLYDRLLEEIGLAIHPDVFDRVYSGLAGGPIRRSEGPEQVGMEDTLASFDGRALTVAEFFDEALFTSLEQRTAVQTPDVLEAFLEGIVIRLSILERARDAGVDGLPEFNEALEDEMDAWVYEQAWRSLEKDLDIPDDTLRAFYALHQEDFERPEAVFVTEILVDAMEDAVELRRRVTPANFGQIAALHSVRPGADEKGGELGFVTRDQLGVLAGQIFSAHAGDILGPIEVAGKHALILVGEKQPAAAASFEDARDRIAQTLRLSALKEYVGAHAQGLRGTYDVEVFEEVLGSLELREQEI